MPNKKSQKKQKQSKLEEQYRKFFKYTSHAKRIEHGTLKQPSLFEPIKTWVTYGAYEEAI